MIPSPEEIKVVARALLLADGLSKAMATANEAAKSDLWKSAMRLARASVKAMSAPSGAIARGVWVRPSIMAGCACVVGTRVPVSAIAEFSAAGYTTEAIGLEYPHLPHQDITDALAWWNADEAVGR